MKRHNGLSLLLVVALTILCPWLVRVEAFPVKAASGDEDAFDITVNVVGNVVFWDARSNFGMNDFLFGASGVVTAFVEVQSRDGKTPSMTMRDGWIPVSTRMYTKTLDMRTVPLAGPGYLLGGGTVTNDEGKEATFSVAVEFRHFISGAEVIGTLDLYLQLWRNISLKLGGGGNVAPLRGALVNARTEYDVFTADPSLAYFAFRPDGYLTDDNGGIYIRPTASLDSPVGADGYVSGDVTLSVSSPGGKEDIGPFRMKIPFARVMAVTGEIKVMSDDGLGNWKDVYGNDVFGPNRLFRIGGTLEGPHVVEIMFCDGRIVTSSSEDYVYGYQARLGADSLWAGKRSLVALDLQHSAMNFYSLPPTKKIEFVVEQGLRKGVSTVANFGGVLGWAFGQGVSKTVFGVINAVRPGPRMSMGLRALDVNSGMAVTTNEQSQYVRMSVYSDGTVQIENGGDLVTVSSDRGASLDVPRGAAMMANCLNTNKPLSGLSAPAFVSDAPPSVAFSPSDGASVLSRVLEVGVAFSSSAQDPVLPASARCRVNGTLRPMSMTESAMNAVLSVTPEHPLRYGSNTIEVTAATLSGARLCATSVVHAVEAPEPPAFVRADPGRQCVGLDWTPSFETGLRGYEVYRSDIASSVGSLVTTSAVLSEAVWFDASPLQTNYYSVVTVLTNGVRSIPSSQVMASTDAAATNFALGAVSTLALLRVESGVRITFADSSAGDCRAWRVERGEGADGPFADLLAGQWLAGLAYVDTTVSNGVSYRYRVIPVGRDCSTGTPAVAGPITVADPAPAAPEGLSLAVVGAKVRLQWDPHPARDLEAVRVYRREATNEFQLVSALPPDATEYSEAVPASGASAWMVTALDHAMQESVTSAVVEFDQWSPGGPVGLFGFEQPFYAVGENAGTVTVSVVRSGGTNAAAFVQYGPDLNAGSAMTNVDYTPVVGTLFFEQGQTTGRISIPVLADAVDERDERFRLRLVVVGAQASASTSATVTILGNLPEFPAGGKLPADWGAPSNANANWSVVSNVVSDGTFSLKANAIDHGQNAAVAFFGEFLDGSISFSRKVSSEARYDFLEFRIDGVLQERWSGDIDWETVSYAVAAGLHTVSWTYIKDSGVSRGEDTVWVDEVTLPVVARTLRVGGINLSGGSLVLVVNDMIPTLDYRVERTTDLLAQNWQTTQVFYATSVSTNVQENLPAGLRGYYRIGRDLFPR